MVPAHQSSSSTTRKSGRRNTGTILSRAILNQSRRPEARKKLTRVLGEQATRVLRSTADEYREILSPDERISQDTVDAMPWAAGNWFRPIHNRVVPLAMAVICRMCNTPRDFMHAAIWHDVGYTTLTVPNTDGGLTWASIDMRKAHMKRGAELFKEFAEGTGKSLFTTERAERFRAFIAVHDEQYIGGTIKSMDRPLREADRVFVPSLFSFYKDYISYAAKAADEQQTHPVEDHFIRRLQNFYRTKDEIPARIRRLCPRLIDKRFGEVDKELITERFEPQETVPGKKLIEAMLVARAQELKFLKTCTTLAQLREYIGKRGEAEFRVLMRLARKKS
jgi:hypothetical protein